MTVRDNVSSWFLYIDGCPLAWTYYLLHCSNHTADSYFYMRVVTARISYCNGCDSKRLDLFTRWRVTTIAQCTTHVCAKRTRRSDAEYRYSVILIWC